MPTSQPLRKIFRRTADGGIDINAIPVAWFIGEHRSASEQARHSMLLALHRTLGAQFVTLEDVQWVERYGNVYREYAAIKTAAGMLDVSVMAHVELTGELAVTALQQFFSNDIVSAADGVMRYGALLDEHGKVLDDCIVYKFSDTHVWLVLNLAELPESILERWHDYRGKLQYRNLGTAYVKIQVQGPQAPEVIKTEFPGRDAERLAVFAFTEDPATQTVIGRCGYSGEDGFEIFVPQNQGLALWSRLQQAGAIPYGIAAIEYCRVESGLLSLNDYLPGRYFPQEIGLGDFVKAATEPYLLAFNAIVSARPSVEQWYLLFDPDLPPGDLFWEDAPHNGATVRTAAGHSGTVTSLVYSPLFKRFAGLASFPHGTVHEHDTVCVGAWRATVATVKSIRAMKKNLPLELPV
ncbi:MAG: hypothetical protein ACU837_09260 [Gammaproteobacteria bacterium]